MGKIITFILMTSMMFSLSACDSQNNEVDINSISAKESATSVNSNVEDSKTPKALVVYFSQTGNTSPIAKYVAEIVGADLFEIVPDNPYTDDDINYNDDSCRANKEQADESCRPVISTSIDNLENYDTIFIAFPIWWGKEPRIIDTFIEAYDFSGKTMIPLCTSGGSGISTAEGNLHNKTGDTVTWLKGHRFEAGASKDEVSSWINGLEGLN